MLSRSLHSLALLPVALTLVGAVSPTHAATPPGCAAIVQASVKRLAAPMFHIQHQTDVGALEMLKTGGTLYLREPGKPWRKAPATTEATMRKGAEATGAMLQSCTREKTETLNGIATEVWRFTTPDFENPAKPATSRVWIGVGDGLPYREEAEGLKGTTVYSGVKAPI